MRALKLRQAEVALRDGRLDEAYDLLVVPDIHSHRRGQALTTDLIGKLKARIVEHRNAQLFDAALKDCNRALHLGGNQADLATLKNELLAELTEWTDRQNYCRRIQREVRDRIVSGDLSLGQVYVDQLPNQARQYLRAEIEMKQQAADKSVERAEAALLRDSLEEAVEALEVARSLAANGHHVRELAQRMLQRILQDVLTDLKQGHLGQAEAGILLAEPVATPDRQLTALTATLLRCADASHSVRRSDYAAARGELQIIRQSHPDTDWIDATLESVDRAQAAQEALQTSPLSSLQPGQQPRRARRQVEIAAHAISAAGSADSPQQLVQVDGAGRLLVVSKSVVRLGRRRTPAVVDVGLQMAGDLPDLLIERRDDDYFMSSEAAVRVNGVPARSRLLSDGDQLVLGNRCGIRFRLPCAASRSALLQFSGTRLEPPDVRTVILMDDGFIIGADAQAHLRVRQLRQRFIVLRRPDGWYVQPVAVDRQSERDRRRIESGVPVDLGGATLLVSDVHG